MTHNYLISFLKKAVVFFLKLSPKTWRQVRCSLFLYEIKFILSTSKTTQKVQRFASSLKLSGIEHDRKDSTL